MSALFGRPVVEQIIGKARIVLPVVYAVVIVMLPQVVDRSAGRSMTMNAYERSYKRAGADGEANSALIETLRADGIFRVLAPQQQPLVEELVAQLDRQAQRRRGRIRVLLTPGRLYMSVKVVLRRCEFETPESEYLFDAIAQNAVRVSIDAESDGIHLFVAIRNRDEEAEARSKSYKMDDDFLRMLQDFFEE